MVRDPAVRGLAAALAFPPAVAAWSKGPLAVGLLAKAHADIGHAGPDLGAALFRAAAEMAGTGGAAGDTSHLVAAAMPALNLASSSRAGTLHARAGVLAAVEACLVGGPLARAARARGPEGVRLAVDAAAAAAAVLGAAEHSRSGWVHAGASPMAVESAGEALWGGGAREMGGGGGGGAGGMTAAGRPPPPLQPPLPSPADAAPARRILTAALEAVAGAGDANRLVPRAVARVGRALADSRALRGGGAGADAGAAAATAAGPDAALLFSASLRAVRALARAAVRAAAVAARARADGVDPCLDDADTSPGAVCDTAWALGRAVADLRGRGPGGSPPARRPLAASPTSTSDPVTLALQAAADALVALGPMLQAAAAGGAPAAGVAAAAWALAATGGRGGAGGGGRGGGGWPGAPSGPPPAVGSALDALGARAAHLSPSAPPRFTAQALWALSASRRAAPLAFEAAAHGLLPQAPGMGPAEAAVLGLAYARVGATTSPACAALLDALAVRALAATGGGSGGGQHAAAGATPPAPAPAPAPAPWPPAAAPRALANLAFALAAAGRLPPALYNTACSFAAGDAVGAVELGQLHVAGVALRAGGGVEAGGMGARPPAPPPGAGAGAGAGAGPVRPPAPAGDLFQTLLDAGRVARAAAACWGAGAPLGPATPSRPGAQMVDALAGLAAEAAAEEPWRDWTVVPEHRAAGLAAVDAAFPALRVAVEFDGPSHFFTNSPRPVGSTAFKRRLLRWARWSVVSIPWGDWAQLGQAPARRAYLALALDGTPAALPRTLAARVGSDLGRRGGGSDPTAWTHDPALAAGLVQEMSLLRAAYAGGGGAGAHPGGAGGAAALIGGAEEAGEAGEAGERGGEVEDAPQPSPLPPPPPPPDPALLAQRLAAVQFRKGKIGLGSAVQRKLGGSGGAK